MELYVYLRAHDTQKSVLVHTGEVYSLTYLGGCDGRMYIRRVRP